MLGPVCFKSNNQVTKTLTITQLSKHRCKLLVPAGGMLHVAIAIILTYVIVKLSRVQKSGKLSKKVFVLEPTVNYIWLQSYKIKSVSFKTLLNKLNSNYFKERLVHFDGTVVK